MISVALGYIITGESSYLNATREILFGGPNVPQGLVYIDPYPQTTGSVTWPEEFFRTKQVLTLAMVADILWNSLTQNERYQIGYKCALEIDNEIRDLVFQSWFHINNNHLARIGMPMALSAITFYDLYDYENTRYVYPQALTDLARVRDLVATDLNGKKNVIERLYDTEGSQVEGFEYSLIGLSHDLPLLEAFKRFYGVDYINSPEIQKRLSKLSDWVSYEIVPAPRSRWYYVNDINDSDIGSGNGNGSGSGTFADNGNGITTVLLGLGGYYQTPTTRWVFENSVETVSNLQTSNAWQWQSYSRAHAHLITFLKYDELPLVSPETVLPKSKLFPERGLVYVRSSDNWADNDDIQFALEGAPCINPANNTFSVKHDQADKNHFTLQAFGYRLIRDYGRGWGFGGQRPESHNYIMIDNKGEAIGTYWDGDEEKVDLLPRPGRIVSHVYDGTYTFIHGDAKDAFSMLYSHNNGIPYTITEGHAYFNGKPNAYVNPVLNADRFVMFNQAEETVPAYIVISDDINKDNSSHDYEWLFHSDYNASGDNPITINRDNVSLTIWHTSYSPLSKQSQSFSEAITSETFTVSTGGPISENGSGETTATSYSHSISKNAVNPYFHVVLYPSKAGMAQPTVTFPITTGGSAVYLNWPDYTDYSLFKYNGSTVSSLNITSNAKLTQLRIENENSNIISYSIGNGSNLVFDGALVAETYGINATVMYSSDKVVINGDGVEDFKVFAPNATSVEVNGDPVGFTKIGNYVESNIVLHSRTWSGNITITSNVFVSGAAILTINPGTVLSFQNNSSLVGDGAISANGTSSNRITFDFINGIGGIDVQGGYTKSFTYCNINNASVGIELYSGSITVDHCNITNCLTGIDLGYSGGTISNNTIEYCTNSGIRIYTSSPSVYGNTIRYCNNGDGIKCLNYSTPNIDNNTISENYHGIYIYDSSPQILNNQIVDNYGNGIYGEANGKSPLIKGNKIKKTSGNPQYHHYQGIYLLNNTNPFITENDIQGFDYGIYFGGGGSGNLTDGSFITPAINNRFVDNKKGITVAYSSYLTAGVPGHPYTGRYNSIYGNSPYDATAYQNGTLIAWYNWWGSDGAQTYTYSGGMITALSPLGYDPWAGIPLSPVSADLEISQSDENLFENEFDDIITGISLESEKRIQEAIGHYKQMIDRNTHSGFALSRLVGIKNTYSIHHIQSYIETLIDNKESYNTIVLNLLAGIYLDNERYDEAMQLYDKIITEYPNSYDAVNAKFEKFFAALHYKNDKALASQFLSNVRSTTLIDEDFQMRLEVAEHLFNSGIERLPSVGKTGILAQENIKDNLPKDFELLGNYPNPFNPSTTISFALPYQSAVELTIFDLLGNKIKSFNISSRSAGYQNIVWDGTNENGNNISSGIYLYKISIKSLETNETFVKTAKLMMLK